MGICEEELVKEIEARIKCNAMAKKVADASVIADLIKSGMTLAMSSNVRSVGDELIKIAQEDENFKIDIWSGLAELDIDRRLGPLGAIRRRIGQQLYLRKLINQGISSYSDVKLGSFYQNIRRGDFGVLDYAVVEAVAIKEDGALIPSHHFTDMASFVQSARKVIIQLNTAYPETLEGLHDIYIPLNPPRRDIIPIKKASDRIGTTYLPVDFDKVECIIPAHIKEPVEDNIEVNDTSRAIADHLIDYFRAEIKDGWITNCLLPIEIGLGSIAKAILQGLMQSEFENLEFYTAILSDGILDLIDADKVKVATGTVFFLSDKGESRFFSDLERYKKFFLLRPLEITDSPEVVGRLGAIAINGAVEVDIYGNVNSSHLSGGDIVSGVGGGMDFALNAYLSVFVLSSITKRGDSCIVPMASHVDIPEHGVDVIITEQGIADLRGGLSPEERALRIIENCVHPNHKDALRDYFHKAKQLKRGHEPQILAEAVSWRTKN